MDCRRQYEHQDRGTQPLVLLEVMPPERPHIFCGLRVEIKGEKAPRPACFSSCRGPLGQACVTVVLSPKTRLWAPQLGIQMEEPEHKQSWPKGQSPWAGGQLASAGGLRQALLEQRCEVAS